VIARRWALAAAALLAACQGDGGHAIVDRESGLRLELPQAWTRWDAAKLRSPAAVRANLVAYAADPDKRALVSVRRFRFRMAGSGELTTGDAVDRLKPEDRPGFLTMIERQVEKDLAAGAGSWETARLRHGAARSRGWFVEVEGRSREGGEAPRWVKSVLLLPRKTDDLLEIRLTAPLSERARYQADLERIEAGIRKWLE